MESSRVAVIVGAASGIGLEITRTLSAHGYTVVALDVNEPDLMRAWDELKVPGLAQSVDVTDGESLRRAGDRIGELLGAIHLLVVSAGSTTLGDSSSTTDEVWKSVMGVNLDGAFKVARAFLPMMKESDGTRSVVFMQSVLAIRGWGNMLAYSAAKAGVGGLVRGLAQELAPSGITVNGIAAGPVETSLLRRVQSEAQLEELRACVPLGRLGSVRDIAQLVHFLGSEGASFISGQTIVADGGLSSRAYWRP